LALRGLWGIDVRARIPIAAALTLALGGCVGDYTGPGLPAEDTPKEWSAPIPSDASIWPKQDWWRGFASDELNALIAAARTNNLDLAAARARVEAADAQARIAGASLLPTLSASLGGTESGDIHGPGVKTKLLTADLRASYELDFWGRNLANARAGDASLRASRYDQETVALTTTSSVATTYFQVLAARDRLRFAKQNSANADRVLELTELQLKAGLISPLQMAQQQTVAANQRAQLPAIEQQERQAVATLAVLLGQAPQGFTVAGQSLEKLDAPSVAPGLTSELLARRPDVARAEANLAAADANVGAARAAFLPAITLTGNAGVASTALSGLLSGSNAAYTIGAALLQTIFDSGRLAAQEDLAMARRTELLATYRRTAITAFSDVDVALSSVANLAAQERETAKAAAAAAEAFRIAELQYRAGLVDFINVLNTQQSMYSAQDQLAQVKGQRLQAIVGLYRVLGGGWSEKR
jgi:NodT family efflux transporter outer membrane factor (OMF) lipoprotein